MKRALLVFLLAFSLKPAVAIEKYYMAIFSYQDGANSIPNSHTFATFAKFDVDQVAKTALLIDAQTISWGPATGVVRLFHRPERGRNSGLIPTIQGALRRGLRVSEWGPYEIHPGLYERAKAKVSQLNSGRILYKVLDKKFRPHFATNCFHAVSDIDLSHGFAVYGTMRGDAASYHTLQHLSPWVKSWQRQDWVDAFLGISKFRIFKR